MQRNLRHDTEYTLIDAYYISLENGGQICANCERLISNIANVKDGNGRSYSVGMDCLVTLPGIKDTLMLLNAEASFQQAKTARSRIQRLKKKYADCEVTIETLPEGKGYYKENGSGVWRVNSVNLYGGIYKQYPADVWQSYVHPMIADLAT